ncbi:MAG: hypothetical protein ACR2PR_02640 [Pseudohongiellaceae bacterium]
MNTDKTKNAEDAEYKPPVLECVLGATFGFLVAFAIDQIPLMYLLVVVVGVFVLFTWIFTRLFCGFLGAIADLFRHGR